MQVIEKDADVPTIFYYQPNVFDNKELEFVKEFNFREGTKNVTRKQLWFHEGLEDTNAGNLIDIRTN